ncbi:hypothetical protein XELAEV_18032803mg [Xenopus laevis]|uniref:Tetratricopeptide repeat protein 21A/21B C-terminal ARM domain-containing protein n=1 Tax=Xenopus laevis TaxID=8355 RepID=A0A974CI99_XENLA|nr:hypothetical protein XELAEV_18032803mg [Xenopus laevis]
MSKMAWSIADAEDLEKSWLLLADIYIKSGKYDIATELLKRCLLYNKVGGEEQLVQFYTSALISLCNHFSLAINKAYEFLGFIMEKEQWYKDAAANYRLAWDYSNQSNPAVDFNFGCLGLRKGGAALALSRGGLQVLKDRPTYPKIKKEILAKHRLL